MTGLDALAVAMAGQDINGPEGIWLRRRANWFIDMCKQKLGAEWATVVPDCASILLLAEACPPQESEAKQCIRSFTLLS